MSRHSKSASYGHKIRRFGNQDYRLFWTVDFYYRDSRLRFPRGCHRDTDEAGALRFAKRWKIDIPKDQPR